MFANYGIISRRQVFVSKERVISRRQVFASKERVKASVTYAADSNVLIFQAQRTQEEEQDHSHRLVKAAAKALNLHQVISRE